ncbi:hypothetical protein GCM10011362_28920 [Marinobacter halophilus]|nr:hypothetical protein GCM10011362_28920 [Marinobacter halophilus]
MQHLRYISHEGYNVAPIWSSLTVTSHEQKYKAKAYIRNFDDRVGYVVGTQTESLFASV